MSATLEIVPATEAHATSLGGRLREADAAEIRALGLTGVQALGLALSVSMEGWTVLDAGEPIAMYGYSAESLIAPSAAIWLLTAPGVVRCAPRLLGVARRYLDRINTRYGVIENMADLSYDGAVKLAHMLGFVDHERVEIGGRSFIRMRRTAPWASNFPPLP